MVLVVVDWLGCSPVAQRLLGPVARRGRTGTGYSIRQGLESHSVGSAAITANFLSLTVSTDPCPACASVRNGWATRRATSHHGATPASNSADLRLPNSKAPSYKAGMLRVLRSMRFPRISLGPVGSVALRVIATQPARGSVYRLDQLIASMARRTLWLSDAYFVGITPYVQALVAAARDGVDVRLLVPGSSDIPAVARMSRSGYRPLLKAGIRVFEWNGSMLHAKTAVADGQWARVGSSNLNISSWLGNCEVDIAVEDAGFASLLAAQYELDLQNATEIVLAPRRFRRGEQILSGAPRASKDSSRRGQFWTCCCRGIANCKQRECRARQSSSARGGGGSSLADDRDGVRGGRGGCGAVASSNRMAVRCIGRLGGAQFGRPRLAPARA